MSPKEPSKYTDPRGNRRRVYFKDTMPDPLEGDPTDDQLVQEAYNQAYQYALRAFRKHIRKVNDLRRTVGLPLIKSPPHFVPSHIPS